MTTFQILTISVLLPSPEISPGSSLNSSSECLFDASSVGLYQGGRVHSVHLTSDNHARWSDASPLVSVSSVTSPAAVVSVVAQVAIMSCFYSFLCEPQYHTHTHTEIQ